MPFGNAFEIGSSGEKILAPSGTFPFSVGSLSVHAKNCLAKPLSSPALAAGSPIFPQLM